MKTAVRAITATLLAFALSAAAPIAALADPGDVDATLTIDDGDATVDTTGTHATASVSDTSVTIGSPSGVTSPDVDNVGTGSGATTVEAAATTAGSGSSVTSGATNTNGAAISASSANGLGQSGDAALGVNEPVTQTNAQARAQANAILCVLALASVDPTWARLSTLCPEGASTANGAVDLAGSNGITGTTVATGTAARAALCLLAFAATPAPGTILASKLANARLSTLCGEAPSTVGGSGNADVTEDRTGTSISAGPAAEVAACLLAKARLGTTTIADLATTCAPANGGTPSTVTGSSPASVTDATTGTTAELQPAADAAICLLAQAVATVPADPTDAAAVADLNTACATSAGNTPSNARVGSPGSAGTGGSSADVQAAADAALCVLAHAGVSLSTASVSVADACGTTTTSDVPSGGTSNGGADAVGGVGSTGGGAPAASGVLGFTGLPSTSTAAAGLGLGLLLVAMGIGAAAAARKRRSG